MAQTLDKETKKIMDEFERLGVYKASTKESVDKFISDGGMENQELIDGAYRYKDDIDGSKFRRDRRKSKIFWIGLVVFAFVLAALFYYGIIPE